MLLISDTKIIQDITSKHVYDFIKPLRMMSDALAMGGKGLTFSEGEDHMRQRKMMNLAFIHNNIKVIIIHCR
jgi:cytochrome P450